MYKFNKILLLQYSVDIFYLNLLFQIFLKLYNIYFSFIMNLNTFFVDIFYIVFTNIIYIIF